MERRIEPEPCRVRIVHAGRAVADTTRAVRVTEPGWTAFYVPRADVLITLVPSARTTACRWKGTASYWSIGGDSDVAWSYDDPLPEASPLRGHIAFHPSRVDECWVGDRLIP